MSRGHESSLIGFVLRLIASEAEVSANTQSLVLAPLMNFRGSVVSVRNANEIRAVCVID